MGVARQLCTQSACEQVQDHVPDLLVTWTSHPAAVPDTADRPPTTKSRATSDGNCLPTNGQTSTVHGSKTYPCAGMYALRHSHVLRSHLDQSATSRISPTRTIRAPTTGCGLPACSGSFPRTSHDEPSKRFNTHTTDDATARALPKSIAFPLHVGRI